eukprot:symbB.v1.2.039753.t1/scaffold6766.1/size15669/2
MVQPHQPAPPRPLQPEKLLPRFQQFRLLKPQLQFRKEVHQWTQQKPLKHLPRRCRQRQNRQRYQSRPRNLKSQQLISKAQH